MVTWITILLSPFLLHVNAKLIGRAFCNAAAVLVGSLLAAAAAAADDDDDDDDDGDDGDTGAEANRLKSEAVTGSFWKGCAQLSSSTFTTVRSYENMLGREMDILSVSSASDEARNKVTLS